MTKRNDLTVLMKELIARPYNDLYRVGLQFFFNLRNLESLAGQYCIEENRSPEENGIYRHGGYATVPDLNFLELETYLWEKIKSTIIKNNITFTTTCMALTYEPHYHKVNMHLHRESLRKINPSIYNYTFFFCDTHEATTNFNVVDKPIPREDIFQYNLIDYVSVNSLKEYIKDMPTVSYNLTHGDVMRFDATKVVHGASNNFVGDEIGMYLVLNGCADELIYKEHQVFKNCFQ